ncbi:MAG: outer membrane lipoprotein carrier protein LolA [Planctomycetes bacterium]|nr:outer membrane lipoprotein carrier protein LolA [Planctomycetota bacterium]
MRTLIVIAGLLLSVVVVSAQGAPPAPPAPPPPKKESVDDVLKRIEKEHADHKTFAGKFKQEKHVLLFDDVIESSGRFVFKKPDHVRWEYTKPHESILVIAGDDGQKWNETTKKVEKFKLSDERGLDAVVKQLFTWFKGEFTKMTESYTVTLEGNKPTKLKMAPKNDTVKKFISSIEVTMSSDEKYIDSVKIVEPGDDYTLYTFSEAKLDGEVKDEEFEIKK